MKVPAFADIGKEAKELLYGGRTIGIYQYDRKLAVNAKTSHAVDFALTSMARDGLLTMDTKATYKQGPLSIEVLPSRNKVTGTFSQLVVENLKVTLTGGLPDLQQSGKVTLDYAHPYLTGKAACSLNASPKLDISAAAGYSGFVLGADASVDVSKSQLTKWSAALAFVGPEFIVAGHLLDVDTYKATYYQKVDAASSVGAEVVYNHASQDKCQVHFGYSHTALNGDLHKLKISNDGTAQALYEFKLRPELTTAISLQVNTIKEAEAPKMGIAFEYNP